MVRPTTAAIDSTGDTQNLPRARRACSPTTPRSREAGRAGSLLHAVLLPMMLLFMMVLPEVTLAQASPFMTGATALQTNLLAWLTPIAIILVMVLGGMAMANRISWGWALASVLGIAIGFGAPQIVTWVRGMFGV